MMGREGGEGGGGKGIYFECHRAKPGAQKYLNAPEWLDSFIPSTSVRVCVCARECVHACGVACCSSCVSLFMRACACLLFPAFLPADGRVLHLVNQDQQQSSTDHNEDGTASVNASPISQSPAVLQPQAETSLPSFSRPFHAIPLGLPAWASFTAVAVGMSHCLAITGEVGEQ